uniref:Uncharacterized protein n=1 Tax=Anguilla anguilla TaxID=7936 RepID=A0A0E9QDH9_ANGAN
MLLGLIRYISLKKIKFNNVNYKVREFAIPDQHTHNKQNTTNSSKIT